MAPVLGGNARLARGLSLRVPHKSRLYGSLGRRSSLVLNAQAANQTTVGVLGGGQLGQMLAQAASPMGVHVKCLDPTTPKCPAALAGAEQVNGNFADKEAVLAFAEGCDVVTVEIEHVSADALQALEEKGVDVQPPSRVIGLLQDKFKQKGHMRKQGVGTPEFVPVINEASFNLAMDALGFPFMLKSRKLAYDGRGNAVVHTRDDADAAFESLGGYDSELYAEQWCNFSKELAVMVALDRNDNAFYFPVVETTHVDSICHTTITPPQGVSRKALKNARKLAEDVVNALRASNEGGGNICGVFGIEMFLLEDGETVLYNEVAPRPHNSGHYSIEGCYVSQFEAQIRVLLRRSLTEQDVSLKVGAAGMLNVLGQHDGEDGMNQALGMMEASTGIHGASAHWYGKTEAKYQRKLGHITVVGENVNDVWRNVMRLDKPHEEHHGSSPVVGVIMGSDSDLATMGAACETLEQFGIPYEVSIVSAHRTPERMVEYARTARDRGLKVIIAGAGGAAHLPGMVAACTPLPVVGVPVKPQGYPLDGVDALLSIACMPKGVPVATVAIGNSANAALLAARMLGGASSSLCDKMEAYQEDMEQTVKGKAEHLENVSWREYHHH